MAVMHNDKSTPNNFFMGTIFDIYLENYLMRLYPLVAKECFSTNNFTTFVDTVEISFNENDIVYCNLMSGFAISKFDCQNGKELNLTVDVPSIFFGRVQEIEYYKNNTSGVVKPESRLNFLHNGKKIKSITLLKSSGSVKFNRSKIKRYFGSCYTIINDETLKLLHNYWLDIKHRGNDKIKERYKLLLASIETDDPKESKRLRLEHDLLEIGQW